MEKGAKISPKIVRYKKEKYKIVGYSQGAIPHAYAFWLLPKKYQKILRRKWQKVQSLQLRLELAKKFPKKRKK